MRRVLITLSNPLHVPYCTIQAVDIIVGILPVDMFSDVFDALCPILELIGDVLSFLGGGGDYEEDGCFTDDAGIFGSLLNVVSFGGAWYVNRF